MLAVLVKKYEYRRKIAISVGDSSVVRGFLRRTAFKLPKDPSTPIIMVGAGTGLAPLRGMCHHIEERRKQLQEGQTHGTHMLIFGCRRRDHDFLYAEEIQR